MPRTKKIDRPFLIVVAILTVLGFFIFLSASLGLTAQDHTRFSSLVLNQLLFGIVLGSIFAFVITNIKYNFWRKYSFWFFLVSLLMTLAVFIPGIGLESGGAKRWILLGPLSFQPAEALKVATVLYFATWLSGVKTQVSTLKYGLLPLIIILAIVGGVLLAQPDTDTFVVLAVSLLVMFVAAGAKWKHLLLIVLVGLIGFSGLVVTRPYIKDRIITFIDPSSNPLDSGYQIQQSLIAIGSGGITGRGFGQSLQKFNFLPEPVGDSIFAVYAEEFGFIGALLLILLFVIFFWRGLKIASKASDTFGGLVVIGLVILITTQAFINISAMLGVIPLSGLPLIFVSHGGSALFITLASIGIILSISKNNK